MIKNHKIRNDVIFFFYHIRRDFKSCDFPENENYEFNI